MSGARTRGQPAALDAVLRMVSSRTPHAILLAGPSGVGKTTLALDLAAGLLCSAASSRPCGACRACRMVESGNHPDLHRLAPEGPGGQIRIGARTNAEPGTVRRLVADLALLPVEGGARIAIIEHADRMNEDAQSALLKTLEEPPLGVTLVLCADEEERLLPTVRSRCARLRMGPVRTRDIEALLAERAVADPPAAARLARLSGGRPGVAIALAAVPAAVAARTEIGRVLLDLTRDGPARRLAAAADLAARAAEVADGLDGTSARAGALAAPDEGDGRTEPRSAARQPASERRRAAHALVDVWRSVARDLAVVAAGEPSAVQDPSLLDDLRATAAELPPPAVAAFLERLTRAGAHLEGNVSPDLVVDSLLVAWPAASAGRTGTAP